jgi:Flp pilus assembly protein TadD
MSVILDALKRVQDENHRRGTSPGVSTDHETIRDTEAMVERLSAPAPEPTIIPEPRRLSPVAWVAIIALCSAGVIMAALWWFEPDFTGARANGGRPLLTELSANTSPRQPANNLQSVAGAEATSASMSAGDQARVQAGAEPNGRVQESMPGTAATPDDLSDLSAGLPPQPASAQPAVRDEPPAFDLRVQDADETARRQPQASGSGAGYIDLSSNTASTPAPRETTRREEPREAATDGNPFAAREVAAPADTNASNTLIDPSVRAAFERGLQLQKAGDMSGAEDAYLRALKLDPTNAQINANLAVLYVGQNRFQVAERHLRDAINVDPNNASAHNNLGVVLYRMGNFDGAMIEFNRTLSLNAEQLDAYTNKGLIFMRWGRYDDARRAFAQVLVVDPDNALAHYNLGLVYEEMQMWEMAINSYYRFLDTGAASHPDVVQYVSTRLPWVEARLENGGQ